MSRNAESEITSAKEEKKQKADHRQDTTKSLRNNSHSSTAMPKPAKAHHPSPATQSKDGLLSIVCFTSYHVAESQKPLLQQPKVETKKDDTVLVNGVQTPQNPIGGIRMAQEDRKSISAKGFKIIEPPKDPMGPQDAAIAEKSKKQFTESAVPTVIPQTKEEPKQAPAVAAAAEAKPEIKVACSTKGVV